MGAVWILGTAFNLASMPLPFPAGVEVWMANDLRGYEKYLQPDTIRQGATHWFNLHSRAHMDATYPRSVEWYQQMGLPIYTQRLQPDFPTCRVFPYQAVTERLHSRYFTCSIAWLLAFALVQGHTRVTLWGYALHDKKHLFERPCFFYWVQRLRAEGVEIIYQPEIAVLPFEPGNPDTFDGPLYGYATKPELEWDQTREAFLEG